LKKSGRLRSQCRPARAACLQNQQHFLCFSLHVQQVEAQSSIGADNVGHKLLQKMGWKEGKGIGAKGDGRTAPVAAGAGAAAAGNNLGLGAEAHGTVKEEDDPFEQYRKRMMLGYK
jgi:splicing factor 4